MVKVCAESAGHVLSAKSSFNVSPPSFPLVQAQPESPTTTESRESRSPPSPFHPSKASTRPPNATFHFQGLLARQPSLPNGRSLDLPISGCSPLCATSTSDQAITGLPSAKHQFHHRCVSHPSPTGALQTCLPHNGRAIRQSRRIGQKVPLSSHRSTCFSPISAAPTALDPTKAGCPLLMQ